MRFSDILVQTIHAYLIEVSSPGLIQQLIAQYFWHISKPEEFIISIFGWQK